MDLSQLPQTVSQTIDAIADKLKVPAEQLLDVAVTGVRVEGIVGLVIGLLGFIGIPILYKKAFIYLKDEVRGDWVIGAGFMTAVAIFLFIGATRALYQGAIQTFAPAYWLLKSILNF